jgi:hypothetical protein
MGSTDRVRPPRRTGMWLVIGGLAAAAKVTLVITSRPAGASLWFGDASEPRGKTPVRLVVPRAKDPVRATLKADGYVDRMIVVDADRDQSLDVKLDPIEQPHHASSSHASGGGHHHAATASHNQPAPSVEPPKATTPPKADQAQKKYFLLGD